MRGTRKEAKPTSSAKERNGNCLNDDVNVRGGGQSPSETLT